MPSQANAKISSPEAAASVLRGAIKQPERPLTIADAAAASGLPLRDAERGLHFLVQEYRGHLRVTDRGDLLFVFPHGFTQPWKTTDALGRLAAKTGRVLAGVGRFLVRAWLAVVLFAYVAIFVAVLIGLTFAGNNNENNNRRGVSGEFFYVVFRVLGDALFWTFHPFSPFYVEPRPFYAGTSPSYAERRRQKASGQEVPFYERVNRYIFGPPPPPPDPLAMERRIVAEIRARRGIVGLADVMRVTGLPREQADPLMAKLMLDYDGDVSVSEQGGITYRFVNLRKTAEDANIPPGARPSGPDPAWSKPLSLAPLTGNDPGTNVLVTALNGFNLLMAWVALQSNLTLAKVLALFSGVPLAKMPYDGVPIVLGVVPLVFSIALFALPLARAAIRPLQEKRLARERARLSLLREILTRVSANRPVEEPELVRAWTAATGRPPESKEIIHEIVRLGGDVESDDQGRVRYRFADLETETAALEEQRAAADEEEAKVGKVVFASDQ